MRVILCDRCGARIEAPKTGYVAMGNKNVEKTGITDFVKDFDDWDLCADCMQQIEDFVRMKPDMARPRVNPVLVNKFLERNDPILEQQEEELSPEHDAADRPKATIKKPIPARITPEQVEQIKAMVAEGLAVKEIAETVGVSAPTVRKYKKELEDVDGEE